MSSVKPLLKWAGGKRWLVPLLKELWLPHQHLPLVEPFSGGLSVSLGLLPKTAYLNDANRHLVNFYQQVKKGFQIKAPLKNEAEFYYQQRTRFNQLIHRGQAQSPKGAGLFYYLMKTGFNGLCRFNQSGEFNVPFGQYRTIHYRTDFKEYQSLLTPWDFSTGDFTELSLSGDEFIYADPPYDVEFTQYQPLGFNWADQIRLCEWLSQHRGPVIASNQATKRIVTLYKKHGFKILTLEAPRRIACNGNRKPAKEILALSGFSKTLEKKITQLL